MKRIATILAVVAIGVAAVWMWACEPAGRGEAPGFGGADAPQAVVLAVGLDEAEAAVWHHLDEGGGFLPLSFLRALRDAKTGASFLESLPTYGFVPDPTNDFGLPIGLSVGPSPQEGGPVLVGVTCSACHSGQYTYRGSAMNIDGAPNLVDFEALLRELMLSLEETLESPRTLLAFVRDLAEFEHAPQSADELFELDPSALAVLGALVDEAGEPGHATAREHVESAVHGAYHAVDPEEAHRLMNLATASLPASGDGGPSDEHLRSILEAIRDDVGLIRRRTQRLSVLRHVFDHETEAGPGRADSFDVIWDLLVQQDRMVSMNAPVSIPHLFHYAEFHWVHWDGNTSTVMGRDFAQAIALGADYVPSTNESSVLPRNVMALEAVARGFTAPAWPAEILGEIDAELAVRGQAVFEENCASCHSEENVVLLEEVGTDAMRVENFGALRSQGSGYAEILKALGGQVTAASFAAHGVTEDEIDAIERSPSPDWRVTGGYQTRTLRGIWASAPYLHNGSVPTLWDLLQPPAARPTEFAVGREFDPVNVGIDSGSQPQGSWTFRTSDVGNANGGHEYGTDLSDDLKRALIEHLKALR